LRTYHCKQYIANTASKPKSALALKIRELRKQKKLTQEQLAIKAGVSYTTLTKMENGAIKNPSFETVVTIAKGLEVSLDVLTNSSNA
jgi:transcriptional regulator with XRE-family HTH domain